MSSIVVLASTPTNPYAAAADLIERLPTVSVEHRTRAGLSQAAAAKQAGLGMRTLANLELGKTPTKATILKTLRWLARS